MWKISEIKRKGRCAMKKNYWRILGISLLVAFLVSNLRLSSHIDSATEYFVGGQFEMPTNADIVNEWVENITDAGVYEQGTVLKYLDEHYTPKKGVLARVYNRVTADRSVLYGVLNAANEMVFRDHFGQGVIILTGVGLLVLFMIFVTNVLQVGQCRFLLETQAYENSRFDRILFPWRVKRGKKVALVMLEKSLLQFLWDLTIVGGVIKRYSYRMVPYILAENPDLGHREVFQLSREMMKGNKWKAFLLDASFLGWYLINFFTLGILRWVYIAPYQQTAGACLYLTLRADAQERYPAMNQVLNDRALTGTEELKEYPVEQHPLYDPGVKRWITFDYHRKYSFTSVVLMFFSFSFIGWLWEVSLHLFGDGVFVNRGFFHGPWLPIYGTGGVLVLLLLKRFADRPVLTFFLSVAVCGTVEYLVGWFLWETQKMYWWNYSGYFLNLHGRICAEGLLIFGLGSCAFIYVIAPVFDELFRRIPKKPALILCAILLISFAVDGVYSVIEPNSGAGITDYQHHEPEKEDGKKADQISGVLKLGENCKQMIQG